MLEAPTVSRWVARFKTADEFQKKWRVEARIAEELYELSWLPDFLPTNIPITIPSTARAVVDEATDHSDFNPHWIRMHLPTYGLEQDAESTSSRLRAFFPGWLAYQVSHTNDVSPSRDWIKNMYLFGKAVYKTFYDKSEWPLLDIPDGTSEEKAREMKEEVERSREFVVPVILRSVDPLAVYEDPNIGEKKWVIEAYDSDALDILDRYAKWIPVDFTRSDIEKENPKVRIWDCYQIGRERIDGKDVDGIYHQVLIDQAPSEDSPMVAAATGKTPVFLPNEPFPYDIKFSGLGRQSSGKYEHKARGILFAVKSLLEAEARRLTQLDSIISALAWPTLFVTGPRTRFQVKYGPNEVNYVPPGVTATTITPTMPTGPIQQALATLQAGIERGTFGSVIRGDKPAQVTSGAQLAILSGQARLRFGSPHIQHEQTLMRVFSKVGIIIRDVIKHPIQLWQTNDTEVRKAGQLKVSPEDFPAQLPMHVEILNDPEEERERRTQLAAFLFEKGAIDLEEFRERAGIEDTAAMRQRVIRDKALLETPGVIQALGEEFLLESGYSLEALVLEKTARDLMILRSRQELEAQFQQAQGGANTNQLNQTAAPGLNPGSLGGSPSVGEGQQTAQSNAERVQG